MPIIVSYLNCSLISLLVIFCNYFRFLKEQLFFGQNLNFLTFCRPGEPKMLSKGWTQGQYGKYTLYTQIHVFFEPLFYLVDKMA